MIVRTIHTGDPPGRFLKKDEKAGKWFDVGDKKAAEKASQALQEKTPEERSRLHSEAASFLPVSMFQNPMFNLQSGPSQADVAVAVAATKASVAAAAKRYEKEINPASDANFYTEEAAETTATNMEVTGTNTTTTSEEKDHPHKDHPRKHQGGDHHNNVKEEEEQKVSSVKPPDAMEIDAHIVEEVAAAALFPTCPRRNRLLSSRTT